MVQPQKSEAAKPLEVHPCGQELVGGIGSKLDRLRCLLDVKMFFRFSRFRESPTEANTSPFHRKDPHKSPVSFRIAAKDLEDPALHCSSLEVRV